MAVKLPSWRRRTWFVVVGIVGASICVIAALTIPDLIRTNLERAPFVEGVYVTADEIGGFSGTILELKDGEYRYWFYSDVSLPGRPSYPRSGLYEVDDGRLEGVFGRWTIGNAGDQHMLWRNDALSCWEDDGLIYDYGILIRIDGNVPKYTWELERPSIAVVYEALGREYSDWKDPFVVGAQ